VFVVRLTELLYERIVGKHLVELVVEGMPRAFADLLGGDEEGDLFVLTFFQGSLLLTYLPDSGFSPSSFIDRLPKVMAATG
jgi:hypothetical protein